MRNVDPFWVIPHVELKGKPKREWKQKPSNEPTKAILLRNTLCRCAAAPRGGLRGDGAKNLRVLCRPEPRRVEIVETHHLLEMLFLFGGVFG